MERILHIELTDKEIEVVREAKGMVLAYLQIFSSLTLVSFIRKKSKEAKDKRTSIKLTLTDEDLKRFGIE